jgi:hypothetical protein
MTIVLNNAEKIGLLVYEVINLVISTIFLVMFAYRLHRLKSYSKT